MDESPLLRTLADVVGVDHLLTARDDLAPHVVDWRGRYQGSALCVVRPASTEEVAGVVHACAAAHTPIVPQGGNTGLCGGATPLTDSRAVVVSLTRLDRVRAIDPANNTMTVEAGCLLSRVQEAAAEAGRLFPLSLAAEGSCQIGGNLSTNAGGVQVLRYGTARELTLGLEVVLANGEVWDGLRGLRKDNTGYDLKQLFIGAEGTLGIVTAAVLKLFPLLPARATAWLAIASPAQAIQLLGPLQARFGEALTACEIVSGVALDLVRKHLPGAQAAVPESGWHLLVELASRDDESALRDALATHLAQSMEAGELGDAVLAQSDQQARQLWRLRESIGEAQRREGPSIKHDVSLPISSLAEFVDRADAALSAAFPGIRIVTFGHIGDGNLHYNQSYPLEGDNAAFIAGQERVNRLVHDLVHQLGGSISAEHGIGQLKRDELRRYKSPVELTMMRAVKAALDPLGLMNPGKVL